MFGELVAQDASREVVGTQHFDDEYSGHARYLPPWTTEVDGVREEYGVKTAGAWSALWRAWELRPFWNPPEAAKVAEAVNDKQAAITAMESRLLPRLTPAEAEVYRLHYVAKLSINAIARRARRSPVTVARHLGSLKRKAVALAGGER